MNVSQGTDSKPEELLTTVEAVKEFPVLSKAQLWRWAREDKIPSVLLPSGRYLFRRGDLAKLFDMRPFTTPAAGIPVGQLEGQTELELRVAQ